MTSNSPLPVTRQKGWGCVTAVRTLTILPCPGRDADSVASALPWFPVVGALLGALVAGLCWLVGQWAGWPAGGSVAAVAGSAWLTGGLHLDGLADTVDGWRGGRTRERRLEIMKDSRVGAMGVIALILVLLLQWVAFTRLISAGSLVWIVVPFIAARLAQVQLAVCLPYARAEGGTAESYVKGARAGHWAVGLVSAIILCGGLAGVPGLTAVLVAVLLTLGLGRWMRRVFGGVTGDLLGLGGVVVETVLLFLFAAVCRTPWQP